MANALNDLKENINYFIFDESKKIENYKLLHNKYKEYKILGYIDVILYKEIAKLYQQVG